MKDYGGFFTIPTEVSYINSNSEMYENNIWIYTSVLINFVGFIDRGIFQVHRL